MFSTNFLIGFLGGLLMFISQFKPIASHMDSPDIVGVLGGVMLTISIFKGTSIN